MTDLLLIAIAGVFAYGIYLAAQVTRAAGSAADHLDAGGNLPAWAYIFASGGVMLAAVMPYDQFRMLAAYGFQANGIGLGIVLAALAAALFQKRLQIAASALGTRTLGDTLGAYYQSPSIRIFALLLLALFAIALPAQLLGELGDLVAAASGGAVPRALAVAAAGALLFLIAAIGGWRAAILFVAGLSFLTVVLSLFVGGFLAAMQGGLAVLAHGIATPQGTLADQIPGVIQYSRGLGIEMPAGGPWTTVALASTAIATAAVVFTPGFAFLGLTSRSSRGLAFSQVWIASGLVAGLLLLIGPAIAAELPSGLGDPFSALAGRLSSFEPLAGVALVLALAAGLIVAIVFFTASGASIVTIELIQRFVLPDLGERGQRLSARIGLACIFALVIPLAAFAPRAAAVVASLGFSLAAQLFIAMLGLCWVPWLSRRAVITGLIFGLIMVFFTEPPGLILFAKISVPLPWGRWPLTIHAAAWGLAFNVAIALLAAIFTRKGTERESRERLHDSLRERDDLNFGGAAGRGARWSLTLLWAFFALGPGAILGNAFFSQPMFTDTTVKLGMPSLWVWQLASWIEGVMLVWWLSYWSRLGIVSADSGSRAQSLASDKRRVPRWITLFLGRAAPGRAGS